MIQHNYPDTARWRDFVLGQPLGSFFHLPEFVKFYRACFGKEAVQLLFATEGEELTGLLVLVKPGEYGGLKKLMASRTVVYGGPLVKASLPVNEQQQVVEQLLQGLRSLNRLGAYVQFRNFYDTAPFQSAYTHAGYRYQKRLNSIVDTTDAAAVWRGYSPSRRREVQRSLRNGAVVRAARSVAEVQAFYQLLRELYRKKVRKPLPPERFFTLFFELLQPAGLGTIQLVWFHDRVVGGIVCPVTPGRCVYEWYVCGEDVALRSEGIFPSVLATQAGIDYAVQNNIPQFDFMGLGQPHKPYGVRDFKLRFGGQTVEYGRYNRIENRWQFRLAEMGYNVLAALGRV